MIKVDLCIGTTSHDESDLVKTIKICLTLLIFSPQSSIKLVKKVRLNVRHPHETHLVIPRCILVVSCPGSHLSRVAVTVSVLISDLTHLLLSTLLSRQHRGRNDSRGQCYIRSPAIVSLPTLSRDHDFNAPTPIDIVD